MNTYIRPASQHFITSLHNTPPLLTRLLLSTLLLDLLHASERAVVPTTIRTAFSFHLFDAGPACAVVLAATLVRCEVGEETAARGCGGLAEGKDSQ